MNSMIQSWWLKHIAIRKKKSIPSGNLNIAIENDPVEIVDLPINDCDFPFRYVSLPEGTIGISTFIYTRNNKLHVSMVKSQYIPILSISIMGNFASRPFASRFGLVGPTPHSEHWRVYSMNIRNF